MLGMSGLMLALALMAQDGTAASAEPVAPGVQEVAPGVHLLPGAILPNRGPDGNSVMFDAPRGLIVVDTGRHAWHSDAILAYARTQNRPVAAIFNTHWHLDHSSGNRRIKAVFPQAPLYTTSAIDRAIAAGGFLNAALERARASLQNPDVPEAQKAETRLFVATMEARESLRPDVVVERSQRMRVAGKRLDVHVTDRAVTDADVWLYDRASRVAVIGDLVTLPSPFFETACPEKWSAALDEVWATPFEIAVPGHGPVMSRTQFDTYRTAFNAFMACVNSETAPPACAAVWAGGVTPLLSEGDQAEAVEYAEYYVGMLREHDGRSAQCIVD